MRGSRGGLALLSVALPVAALPPPAAREVRADRWRRPPRRCWWSGSPWTRRWRPPANHRRLPGLGGGGLAAEVGATSRVIGRASGARVRCLRPPYGVDAASAAQVRRLGLRLVLWDVDSNDYLRPGAGVIAARVLGRLRSGDVVLFHDGGGDRSQTVAALDQVLAALSARGFRFSAMCRG
jgi:hypothetical protein